MATKKKKTETKPEITPEQRMRFRAEAAYFRLQDKLLFDRSALDASDFEVLLGLFKQHEEHPEGIPGLTKKIEDLEEKIEDVGYEVGEAQRETRELKKDMVRELKGMDKHLTTADQSLTSSEALINKLDAWFRFCPKPKYEDDGGIEDWSKDDQSPYGKYMDAKDALNELFESRARAARSVSASMRDATALVTSLEEELKNEFNPKGETK